MIFPPQHHWTVDKKSCVTIFSPKGPALTGQYYVLEPGEKVLEKISIGGLSVPVFLRGGYHAFSLPGIHRIQDTVTIEECSPFVIQRESRVKSNVVTCLVTYPADVEKVYRKLFRQLPPVWEITNINTGKGSLAGCFDITSLNRSIVSGRRTGLKPHMANCRVYFVPLSMDIDLPSHLNGNNPQFLDYKDLGRTSEYRLYGIMDNAGPEVLENFAEHIIKALN